MLAIIRIIHQVFFFKLILQKMFEEFHAKKNGLHGLDACVIRREFDIVLALHKFLEFDH